MLYVFKMFVVRLFLFSVLVYNTEAIFDDEYDGATGTTEIATNANTTKTISVTVEDTTQTNRAETIDWYYGSVADEKNKAHGYESVPVEDKIPSPVTTSTDKWSYESDADEKNRTWNYESVPVEDPPAVIDKKSTNLTYEFAVTKPYEDDVGYLTVENGILTAHFPKKSYEKENNSKKIDWPYHLFSEIDEKTTSTRRPSYSYWYDDHKNDNSMNETSYYPYNKHVEESETTTTRRPYYSYWDKETEVDKSKIAAPYYGYKKSINTTTRRPYYSYWDNETVVDKSEPTTPYYGYNKHVEESETTTTRRPYYSYWGKETKDYKSKTTTPYYGYNKHVEESETTTTRRPYYSYWGKETKDYKSKTTTPYYGYNKPVETTTTEISFYQYWRNVWRKENEIPKKSTTPRNLWYYRTTTAPNYVGTTNDTEYYTTTTGVNYNWATPVSPLILKSNSSDRNVTNKAATDQENPKNPTSYRNPVNILINSSNDARNYAAFTDLLKKTAGYILPSASNIAPNSNITNLAVVNGNGNMFFYVFK